jgi:hypothetical protein
MLIPRDIDPVATGAQTPLPRSRPAFAHVEEKQEKSVEKAEKEPKQHELKQPEQKKLDQKKEASTKRKSERTQ